MKRRQLLAAGLGAPLATLAAPAVVRAEGKYPDHIVRLVVPFAPAGPTDIIGRKTAEKMTALLQARRLHLAVRAVLDPRHQSDGVRPSGL